MEVRRGEGAMTEVIIVPAATIIASPAAAITSPTSSAAASPVDLRRLLRLDASCSVGAEVKEVEERPPPLRTPSTRA